MINEITEDSFVSSFNKLAEKLEPFYDFISRHGLSKYDIFNSISHDTFIAICYTCWIANFKPKYDFFIHKIFGVEYLRSELVFEIENFGTQTIFINEKIDSLNIHFSIAIPLSLINCTRVVLPENIESKINDIIKEYGTSNIVTVEKPIYYTNTSKQRNNTSKKVCYIMVDSHTKYVKIGNSVDPYKRERTLQAEKPTIELLHIFNENIEHELHKKFSNKRVRGEWFKLTQNEVNKIIKHYE